MPCLGFTGGGKHHRGWVISFTAWSLSQLDLHIQKVLQIFDKYLYMSETCGMLPLHIEYTMFTSILYFIKEQSERILTLNCVQMTNKL